MKEPLGEGEALRAAGGLVLQGHRRFHTEAGEGARRGRLGRSLQACEQRAGAAGQIGEKWGTKQVIRLMVILRGVIRGQRGSAPGTEGSPDVSLKVHFLPDLARLGFPLLPGRDTSFEGKLLYFVFHMLLAVGI